MSVFEVVIKPIQDLEYREQIEAPDKDQALNIALSDLPFDREYVATTQVIPLPTTQISHLYNKRFVMILSCLETSPESAEKEIDMLFKAIKKVSEDGILWQSLVTYAHWTDTEEGSLKFIGELFRKATGIWADAEGREVIGEDGNFLA